MKDDNAVSRHSGETEYEPEEKSLDGMRVDDLVTAESVHYLERLMLRQHDQEKEAIAWLRMRLLRGAMEDMSR